MVMVTVLPASATEAVPDRVSAPAASARLICPSPASGLITSVGATVSTDTLVVSELWLPAESVTFTTTEFWPCGRVDTAEAGSVTV
ncbi:hypothetical protein D3C80_1862790 [compost metagenome]